MVDGQLRSSCTYNENSIEATQSSGQTPIPTSPSLSRRKPSTRNFGSSKTQSCKQASVLLRQSSTDTIRRLHKCAPFVLPQPLAVRPHDLNPEQVKASTVPHVNSATQEFSLRLSPASAQPNKNST